MLSENKDTALNETVEARWIILKWVISLKQKCFTVHFKSVCLSFCELKCVGVKTWHIGFLISHSKQLLEVLMWHIRWERQNDSNIDACQGAQTLARQIQQEAHRHCLTRGRLHGQQLPSQQSTALQPCCAGAPSLLPASYHKLCVSFARGMHRR